MVTIIYEKQSTKHFQMLALYHSFIKHLLYEHFIYSVSYTKRPEG